MKQSLASFIVGFIFAIGLGVAGMTQPQKVIGFLDVTAWDPSLVMVMIGAIAVHSLAYVWIMKRKSPLLDKQFHVPQKKQITWSLAIGSLIFGMGWGLGGFCPGPAVVSLASGQASVIVFVAMMLVGMFFYRLVEKYLPHSK